MCAGYWRRSEEKIRRRRPADCLKRENVYGIEGDAGKGKKRGSFRGGSDKIFREKAL